MAPSRVTSATAVLLATTVWISLSFADVHGAVPGCRCHCRRRIRGRTHRSFKQSRWPERNGYVAGGFHRSKVEDELLNDNAYAQAQQVLSNAQQMQSNARLQHLMQLAYQKRCR